MRSLRNIAWAASLAIAASAGLAYAQFQRGGRGGLFRGGESEGSYIQGEQGTRINVDTVRTAREVISHSTGTPDWTNAPPFEYDTFTFARVLFKTGTSSFRGFGWGRRLGWWVDFPDADLNLSYRLQQMTTMKTDPDGRVIRLTDPDLADYPFIFMEHPGYMELASNEAAALRKYLLNGGALLVVDFWSTREWEGFERQMAKVLPGRTWVDLPLTHPIFHCVYELPGPMRMLQVPTMQFWNQNHDPRDPGSPVHQIDRGEGSDEMHVRAWVDEKQRVMALAIHNSDVSDGWEREGENDVYFHRYSKKIAYPLGINLIFYLMTH